MSTVHILVVLTIALWFVNAVVGVLQETKKLKYGCYGTHSGNVFMDASCSASERMAVESVRAGAKLKSTGCERSTTGFNFTFEDEERCCKPDQGSDCIFPFNVDGGFSENYKYHINCTGKTGCGKVRTVSMNSPAATCSGGFWDTSNYLYMDYYCIPASRICTADSCSLSSSLNNSNLYIWSTSYPNPLPASVTSSSCSIETDCGATIRVTAIDVRLANDNVCQQTIQFVDNTTQTTVDCAGNNNFQIGEILHSTGNHLTMNFKNSHNMSGGYFWFSFSSHNNCQGIKISCPPNMAATNCDSGHNINSPCESTTAMDTSTTFTTSSLSTDATSSTISTVQSTTETRTTTETLPSTTETSTTTERLPSTTETSTTTETLPNTTETSTTTETLPSTTETSTTTETLPSTTETSTTTETLPSTTETGTTTETLKTTTEESTTTETLPSTTETSATTETSPSTTETSTTTETLPSTTETLHSTTETSTTTETLQSTTETSTTTETLPNNTETSTTIETLPSTTESLQSTNETSTTRETLPSTTTETSLSTTETLKSTTKTSSTTEASPSTTKSSTIIETLRTTTETSTTTETLRSTPETSTTTETLPSTTETSTTTADTTVLLSNEALTSSTQTLSNTISNTGSSTNTSSTTTDIPTTSEQQKSEFPWWVIAVAVSMAIIIALGIYMCVRLKKRQKIHPQDSESQSSDNKDTDVKHPPGDLHYDDQLLSRLSTRRRSSVQYNMSLPYLDSIIDVNILKAKARNLAPIDLSSEKPNDNLKQKKRKKKKKKQNTIEITDENKFQSNQCGEVTNV